MADPENQSLQGNNDGFGLRNIDSKPINTVKWMIRISNLVAASLVIASGVTAFSGVVSLATVISGCYVIIIGSLLCCFELHLTSMDKFVYENFGFMYYWPGRLAFLAFVGTMSFGLDTLGKIAGGYSVFNIFFNLYVLRVHQGYREYQSKMNSHYLNQAGNAAAEDFQVSAAQMKFEDAQKAAKFYSENKESVEAAAQFYGENKQACNKGIKFAANHTDEIGKAAKAGKNAGAF